VGSCIGSRHVIIDIAYIEKEIYPMIEELNLDEFH
jgi:hypothetical protein